MTTQTQSTSAPTSTPAKAREAQIHYDIDAAHSHVGFSVRHMMISNVRGEFTKLTGQVHYDPARPEETVVLVSIDASSVSTREEKRDQHLRSADFFDVAQFPEITFVSRRATITDDGLELLGELTIHGVKRPVTLSVEEITPERVDPWGNVKLGATARARIKRSDFGMVWNAALETGGILVGDEIKIEIEVELGRQK